MTDSGQITDIHKHGKNVEFSKNGKQYEISQHKLSEFRVALQDLHDAVGSVRRDADAIRESMHAIDAKMRHMQTYWHSPSYQSYDDIRDWFHRTENHLFHVLEEIVHRMRASYDNYEKSEMANLANVTPHQK